MFVSANFLGIQYGIDDKIATFFVDRQPPANNLYWKNKLMYLRLEPGWLFIPLIADILLKLGIDREQLLSEKFVSLMESIGHIAAEEELEMINKNEAIEKCIELVKSNYKNECFYQKLITFMNEGANNTFTAFATPLKALHRGDLFLFSVCALHFNDDLIDKIVGHWFALISTLLLLDDAEDIQSDKATNDENAFLEIGLTKEGIKQVKEMVASNLRMISAINRSMARRLDISFQSLSNNPYINHLLNQ